MAYNAQTTRHVFQTNKKVLEVSKSLTSKGVDHKIKRTTIIIDGVKYQGYRQLKILEQLY